MSENRFFLKVRNRWKSTQWDPKSDHPTKLEAEREGLRIVHEAQVEAAIVVEMQPVVVTHVKRENGVHMTHPNCIQGEDYR